MGVRGDLYLLKAISICMLSTQIVARERGEERWKGS